MKWVVIVSALTIAYSPPSRSALISDSAVGAMIAPRSELIDFYKFGPGSILAVSHDGGRLAAQLTWQRKFPLTAAQDGTAHSDQ